MALPYTPTVFTRRGATTIATNWEEHNQLAFDGWRPEGVAPSVDYLFDPVVREELANFRDDEDVKDFKNALTDYIADFVTGGESGPLLSRLTAAVTEAETLRDETSAISGLEDVEGAMDLSLPAKIANSADPVGAALNAAIENPANAKANKATLPINVRDYGAVGNGTTDDTLSIQSAINAAVGRDLYFPPGTYLLRPPTTPAGAFAVTSFAKATRIYGAGTGSTVLKVDLSGGRQSGAIAFTHATFSDITVDGGYTPAFGAPNLHALVQANTNAVVERCHIFNARGSCVVSNGTDIVIRNNRLEKFGDHAVYTSGTLDEAAPYNIILETTRVVIEGNVMIDDPTYHAAGDPVRGTIKMRNNCTDHVIANNVVTGDQCVYVQGDTRRAEAAPRRILIANNRLTATYAGVDLNTGIHATAGDTGVRISEVHVAGNQVTGKTAATTINGVALNRARATVSGNVFSGVGSGVHNGETGDIGPSAINGNTFTGCNIGIYKPGRGTVIQGNTFADIALRGVYIHGAHPVVKGNTFRVCTTGLDMRAATIGADYTVIDGNTFLDCPTAISTDANARTYHLNNNTFINNTVTATVAQGAAFNAGVGSGNRVLTGAALPTTSTDATTLAPTESVATVSTLPTASNAYRGKMVRLAPGGAAPDALYICMRDAANVFSWKLLVTA